MYFLRTLVVYAVLCASGAFAAAVPIDGYARGDVIEINIKMHGVRVSEKLFFQ